MPDFNRRTMPACGLHFAQHHHDNKTIIEQKHGLLPIETGTVDSSSNL
ncbi:hypothetical protein AAJP47_11625 [Psychrobacter sp. B38]